MKILSTLLILSFLISPLVAQPQQIEFFSRNTENTYRNNEIQCNRLTIIQDYISSYEGSYVSTSELGWTGNVDACNEGTISDLAFEKTLQRINYFRRLVGVNNEIIFSDIKNSKCQKAVLMMDAENKLDHYPTADWKCSSPEGIEAAGKSNLSYGGHSSAAITQYIRDAGSGNGAVGHRRWILYPKAHEFGFGSTNWGTALWVIGGNQTPDSIPEYVAYPSPGYFPKTLIYPRWSFSKKGANFDRTSIKMEDEIGSNIDLYIEEVTNGYGDNTVVWVPSINLFDNTNGTDHLFKISIDSIKIGSEYKSYQYSVLGIDPVLFSISGSMTTHNCSEANNSISLDFVQGYQNIVWSTGEENTSEINGLDYGMYSVTITDKLGCENVLYFEVDDSNPPKVLDHIIGNLTSITGESENYSVMNYEGGSYNWQITNGTVISGQETNEVEIKWDTNVDFGTICVQYIDQTGCESNEICEIIDLMTNGLSKIKIYYDIKISPNPATNFLNINLGISKDNLSFTIFNSQGKMVKKIAPPKISGIMQFDVSELSSGIYFLKINSGKENYTRKFIKD